MTIGSLHRQFPAAIDYKIILTEDCRLLLLLVLISGKYIICRLTDPVPGSLRNRNGCRSGILDIDGCPKRAGQICIFKYNPYIAAFLGQHMNLTVRHGSCHKIGSRFRNRRHLLVHCGTCPCYLIG